MSKPEEMETVSFAYPADLMANVKKDMIAGGYFIKEAGTPRDREGHVIDFYMDKELTEQVMFAMIHSNKQTYLLRAVKGLFNAE